MTGAPRPEFSPALVQPGQNHRADETTLDTLSPPVFPKSMEPQSTQGAKGVGQDAQSPPLLCSSAARASSSPASGCQSTPPRQVRVVSWLHRRIRHPTSPSQNHFSRIMVVLQLSLLSCSGCGPSTTLDSLTQDSIEETGPVDTDTGAFISISSDTWVEASLFSIGTCGLRSDRTVVCWGCNRADSTSDTAFFPSWDCDQPDFELSGLSSGLHHTCGLRPDQSVHCFGDGFPAAATPPLGNFLSIRANSYYTCAKQNSQRLQCWGRQYSGLEELAVSTERDYDVAPTMACGVDATGILNCVGSVDSDIADGPVVDGGLLDIRIGNHWACGTSGSLRTLTCWGRNAPMVPLTLGPVTAYDAGLTQVCAIDEAGTVSCWTKEGQTDTPSGVYSEIWLGPQHACALRDDQHIVCWGNNANGQASPP